MYVKGSFLVIIACMLLPTTPVLAKAYPVVGTEGRSSRDFYIQYPFFNGKWAFIYHKVDKNATASGGGYDGFNLKIYHGEISSFSTYSIYGMRGELDYSDPLNPVTTRRDYTIGFGLETILSKYFVIDGRAHLAYDDLAGGVTPEYHLRFGYRVLPASGQRAHSGKDLDEEVELGFELVSNRNLYLQFPYADGKKAYVVYFREKNISGQIKKTYGLDLKKYRNNVAGFEIYTQLGFNFIVNGISFIFPDMDTVISYGVGVEKVFSNYFVISGTTSIAYLGESQLKSELRVRVGYRI